MFSSDNHQASSSSPFSTDPILRHHTLIAGGQRIFLNIATKQSLRDRLDRVRNKPEHMSININEIIIPISEAINWYYDPDRPDYISTEEFAEYIDTFTAIIAERAIDGSFNAQMFDAWLEKLSNTVIKIPAAHAILKFIDQAYSLDKVYERQQIAQASIFSFLHNMPHPDSCTIETKQAVHQTLIELYHHGAINTLGDLEAQQQQPASMTTMPPSRLVPSAIDTSHVPEDEGPLGEAPMEQEEASDHSTRVTGGVIQASNARGRHIAQVPPRQTNLERLMVSLKTHNIEAIQTLFRQRFGVTPGAAGSPPSVRGVSNRPHTPASLRRSVFSPSSRAKQLLFFRQNPQLADQAIRLVKTYFEIMKQTAHREEFIRFIKDCNLEVLNALLIPFDSRNGRAAFYKLVQEDYLSLVIEHIPHDELESLVDNLIRPRRVYMDSVALLKVIDDLGHRKANATEEEKASITVMQESLFQEGLRYNDRHNFIHVFATLDQKHREFLGAQDISEAFAGEFGPV